MEQRRKSIVHNNLQNWSPFRRSTFLGTQQKQAYPILLIHKLKQGIEEEEPLAVEAKASSLVEPSPPPVATPVVDTDDDGWQVDDGWSIEPRCGVWWHDPGNIAITADDLARKPTAEPFICQPCLCAYFWEDIAGRMHCVECDRIPSLKMLKDFWQAIPGPERNAMRAWSAVGWDRWFPSVKTLEQLFSHLAAAQAERERLARAASNF